MASNEQIIEYANYYLDNDVTMKSSADHFGISKKTFQVNMKKLESISPETFKLVNEKKQQSLKNGAIKGGQNGIPSITDKEGNTIVRKKKSISDEEIKEIAELIILNKWTIREAEFQTGISKSTLYDNLTRERLGNDLYNRYATTLEYNKVNTNKDIFKTTNIDNYYSRKK